MTTDDDRHEVDVHGGREREPLGARARSPLARRVSWLIAVMLVGFLGVYATITTVLEGRRFEAAVDKDLLLLDAVVTAARGRLSDAFQLGDTTFLREQLRRIAGEIPGVVVARAYDAQGQVSATLQPVRDDDPLSTFTPGGPPRGLSRMGDEEVAWLARPVHLITALGAGEGPLLGYLILGTSQAKNNQARWTQTALLIVAGVLTLGVMLFAVQLIVSRALIRPVRGLSEGSRRVARGDLVHRFPESGADEVTTLGTALNAMIVDLARMLRSVREGASRVDGSAENIASSARVALDDARAQVNLLAASEDAAAAVTRLLAETLSSIQALLTTSEGVTLSTAELEVAIREIARNTERMREAVSEVSTTAALEVDAIRRASHAVGELGTFVSETAELARHMDETLRRVAATVRESLTLSMSVKERATAGQAAVVRAQAGLDEIDSAFNDTNAGMDRLRAYSAQVGDIVRVIDGITKQVNLLALNASLIAQRGGEHGQSFGVIATEIRDLAERTSAAAAKITTVVARFETDLADCVASMRRGREAIDRGLELGEEVSLALGLILDASERSSSIVEAITDRSERHVAEGKRIVELMGEVRDRVGRLARLTGHQAEESHRILDAAGRMESSTREVLRAAGAQSRGSQLIAETMDRARDIVRDATAVASEQNRVMVRLAELIRAFQELTARNLRRAETAAQQGRELHEVTGSLTTEVQKFNL